jgi:peptidoglycan-associated lipoprotein|tara:strand:+ start:496 stop:1101 length:606 start_codon:yes stop_codon:yes gene_type:complete
MTSLKQVGLVLIALMAATLTGCKTKPKNITPIPGGNAGVAGSGSLLGRDSSGTVNGGGDVVTVDQSGNIGLSDLDEFENMLMDRDALATQTVYFELDRSEIHPDDLDKVEAVAGILAQDAQNKVLIEGHCDERGTEEYNRALGERRALSVRDALSGLGVSADRVRTMSYGEDRPADPGLNDAAYSRNRRGEFVLLKPKPGS